MSWLYSRALVEEYLEGLSLDGERFVPLNTTPMQQAYCSQDRMTVFSHLSRFGMTFGLLTDEAGEDVLTLFQADFPAKTLVQQGKEKESKGSEADSGWKWRESSVKYDPDMRLWKTRQCSLLEDSEWFSETWPRWGLMRDGECWELPMSERPTYVNGSGLLPTITANTYGSCQGGGSGRKGQLNRPSLQTMAARGLWPTPHGFSKDGKSNGPSGNELGRAVNYATPTKSDGTGGPGNSGRRGGENLRTQVGGSLNPAWVEWLMGWPQGWTVLDASATDKYPNVPPKRGES